MSALVACGKTVPPPAEPPIARRSADEIILAARLSPEVAAKAAFEIHRLDAFAACSAAQARFEGQARFKAQSAGGATGGIIGGVVIGGLGLVGGVVTTALAAGLEAPSVDPGSVQVGAEAPDIEGKTGVIVAGVLTGVAVVGAAVITVVLLAGGDDEDDEKKRKALPPILVPVTSTVAGLPGGSVVGQAGGAVGQLSAQ